MLDRPNNPFEDDDGNPSIITTAFIIFPTSGNSYCYYHHQVTAADWDCTVCMDQRRCPLNPLACTFHPTTPGPSSDMYREIKAHLNTDHGTYDPIVVEWYIYLCDEEINRFTIYDY